MAVRRCQYVLWSIFLVSTPLWAGWATTTFPEQAPLDTSTPQALYRVLPQCAQSLGCLLAGDTVSALLRKQELPWRAFAGLSELLVSRPLLTPFHTGEVGGWHLYGFGRTSPRGLAMSFAGRPWRDATFGVLSPELCSPEFVERIELLRGTEAAVLGWDALGIALNVVEPTWRTGSLYTRLWYLNAAYGTGGSDGVLVLSPHPRWELVAGYRRLSSDGRFRNGWSSTWSTRARLRWSPTPEWLVSLTHVFTHWDAGVNGGIDAALSPQWWDELTAQPRFEDFTDRLYRHDITATALWCPDSERQVTAQCWYVPAQWERHYGRGFVDPMAGDTVLDVRWHSWQAGARIQGDYRTAAATWVVGAGGMWWYTPALPFARREERRQGVGYALGRLALWSGARLHSGVRFVLERERLSVNGGVGVSGTLGRGGEWLVDISRSVRSAAAVEAMGAEELWQLLATVRWQHGSWSGEMGGAVQRFHNADIASFTPQPTAHASTIWTTTYQTLPLGRIGLFGTVVLSREQAWRYYRCGVEVSAERRIGSSEVRASIVWELLYPPALQVEPVRWSLQEGSLPRRWFHSGGDIHLTARLGMAFVRVLVRNVLGVAWYRMPYYPQPGRSILFALTWAIQD